jgi:glutaminyl-tRNA synthetase
MCPFAEAHPDAGGKDFLQSRNSDGLKVTEYVGPTLAGVQPDQKFQFERHGYFVADRTDRGVSGNVVFNRVTGLKDSWGK